MSEFKDKFLVINRKHINKLPIKERIVFLSTLDLISQYIPENNYYACNQDEPYAQKVLDIILEGEALKED